MRILKLITHTHIAILKYEYFQIIYKYIAVKPMYTYMVVIVMFYE